MKSVGIVFCVDLDQRSFTIRPAKFSHLHRCIINLSEKSTGVSAGKIQSRDFHRCSALKLICTLHKASQVRCRSSSVGSEQSSEAEGPSSIPVGDKIFFC